MNMHKIRYDIALLPLIILSSDLRSRNLQSMTSQSKCSLKKNKTNQNKKILSFCLFFYLIGIRYSNILGTGLWEEQRRHGRERVSPLRREVRPSVNGVACWEPKAVGVMVCEVTLNIGTVGSPSFFVKEAFAVEVWVSGLPVINHLSPFFSLTAQYKAWHLTPKTPGLTHRHKLRP